MKKCLQWIIAFMAFFAGSIIISCRGEEAIPKSNLPTPFAFPDIDGFPTMLNIPEDNPTTQEGVKLGRYLFYDGRLSGRIHPDSLMSCANCHLQKRGFECGIDHPKFIDGHPFGLSGKHTTHRMLPLVNLVYNHNGYFWNGFVSEDNIQLGSDYYGVPSLPEYHQTNIESIVWMTIVAEDEINGDIQKTVETISNIPRYPPLFRDAFGSEEVTYDRISKAIAQYARTIISYRSRFHKYVRNKETLTDAELRGLNLFYSEEADCFHCHGGVTMMTSNLYYNNAKDTVFIDQFDRFGVTGELTDLGAYKAPSLINCEVRAPYMHDGRFKTLEEVIDFYSEGLVYSPSVHPLMKQVHQGGVHLTSQEKADLLAFLKTLTDHELLDDPAYSKPDE
jgi:cytochrome c peroxidase